MKVERTAIYAEPGYVIYANGDRILASNRCLEGEPGRFEVYVQSFPKPGEKYQITTSGGSTANWTQQGHEIVYRTADGSLAAIPVTPGESLQFGAPSTLFTPGSADLDITEDGQRVLAVVPTNAAAAQSLTVVLNWSEGLKKKAELSTYGTHAGLVCFVGEVLHLESREERVAETRAWYFVRGCCVPYRGWR